VYGYGTLSADRDGDDRLFEGRSRSSISWDRKWRGAESGKARAKIVAAEVFSIESFDRG